MPAKKLRGTEMTSAQGQLTTRKIRALCTQTAQSPVTRDGMSATASASPQTMGV